MDLFEHRDRYPDAPGYRATDTSRDSAAAMESHAGRLQRLVLQRIRRAGPDGMTADECAAALDMDRLSIRPRLSELRKKDEIKDCGARRPNDSGRAAIVWTANTPTPEKTPHV